MKNLYTNTLFFLILTFALSVLTGCTGADNTGNLNAKIDNTPNASGVGDSLKPNPNDPTKTGTPTESTNSATGNQNSSSQYPKIPSALATAEIKKIDGSSFTLENKKGSVVLLNLWATWCGPCRGEMPHLIEMENNFKSKNFEVVGLNTDDESVEDINKFAAEMKLNYQMAYSSPEMMKEFLMIGKFQGIPQSFLIDREGRLRGVFLGGGPKVIATMKETVEEVVNE